MRPAWRRLRARVESDERGEGVIMGLAAIGVTIAIGVVYVGIPFAFSLYQDVSDLRHGRWNRAPEGSVASMGRFPVIGPALPTDAAQAACVQRSAGEAGLEFGPNGWEAPSVYPKPSLGVSQGTIDAWVDQVTSYYRSRQDEWAHCFTTLPTNAVPPPPSESGPAWPGVYDLSYGPTSATSCNKPAQSSLTASGSADALSLAWSIPGASITTTGTMSVTYAFSTNGVPSSGNTSEFVTIGNVRILGTFDTDGDKTVIRNGSMSLTVVGADGHSAECTLDFTGTKR